jgi:hypothetical protein
LDIICGIKNAGSDMPFAQLDALYRHILLNADEVSLKILSFLMSPVHGTEKLGTTLRSLALLLSLSHGQIHLALLKFNSLLDVPPREETEKDIQVLHASLGDFLTDRSRAGSDLFVEQGKIHAEICRRWLQQSSNTSGSSITEIRGFANHLACASVTAELTNELSQFNLVMWITLHIRHLNDITSFTPSALAGQNQNISAREALAKVLLSIKAGRCTP